MRENYPPKVHPENLFGIMGNLGYPLIELDITMENDPFMDDLPIYIYIYICIYI